MSEAPKRVALLARPGPACDNLQSALRQAGADLVLVADPTAGDAAAVQAAAPQAVLVALEPSVEDAIDGFDAILQDPSMIVIYDEVAVAAKREGWDAARWVRHLAAKLGGHQDVLPPGAGSDDGAPPARAASVEAPTVEASVAPPAPPAPQPVAPASIALEPVEPESIAAEPIAAEPIASEPVDEAPAFEPSIELTLDDVPATTDETDDAASFDASGSDLDFGDLSDEMKALLAGEPVEERPAPPRESAPPPVIDWDAPPPEEREPAPAPAEPAAPPPAAAPTVSFTADDLSLVDADTTPTHAGGAATAQDAGAAEAQQGAVVVLAGIGGPDAVRQLLGALPEGFARPVVVRQRLDGGRHDRLVQQMQRATTLPVALAEAGTTLQSGRIYILPDGMTTTPQGESAVFSATDAPVPVLAGLSAGDSAILLLSGSDPAVVPEVMAAASQGALVAGQALDDCFDSAASAALVAAGGQAIAPADFAQRLSTRWLSLSL